MNARSPSIHGTDEHRHPYQQHTTHYQQQVSHLIFLQLFSDKLTAAASSQKNRLSLEKWDIHSLQFPIRTHFCNQPCPQVPLGRRVKSLDRVSAQHGWTYLNVCTIGTQKHHYFLVVTAKASQNMKQIISIPTVLIFQTDLLRTEKKKKKNLFNISSKLFSLS